MMRRARIVVTSTKPDTYVDVLAAIAAKGEADEVEFIFLETDFDKQLLSSVQKLLVELSDLPDYEAASRLKISGAPLKRDLTALLKSCNLVDVTGVPKELAIEIAATALPNPRIKVCNLRWLGKIDSQERFRIGQQVYSYADVINEPALRALRKDFIAKNHVIWVFGLMVGASAVLAVSQLVFGLAIPDKVINILSLLVGLGGLLLAYVSLKRP
jgi:hypothetical protein